MSKRLPIRVSYSRAEYVSDAVVHVFGLFTVATAVPVLIVLAALTLAPLVVLTGCMSGDAGAKTESSSAPPSRSPILKVDWSMVVGPEWARAPAIADITRALRRASGRRDVRLGPVEAMSTRRSAIQVGTLRSPAATPPA